MTMDEKATREMETQVREYLLQIALELESAAAGARGAAGATRDTAWPHVQQMYTRLQAATHLVENFQKTINEAFGKQGPAGGRPAPRV